MLLNFAYLCYCDSSVSVLISLLQGFERVGVGRHDDVDVNDDDDDVHVDDGDDGDDEDDDDNDDDDDDADDNNNGDDDETN